MSSKKVEVYITEIVIPNNTPEGAPGLCLECTECGHQVTVNGTGPKSARYGYVKLKEECPEEANNFYTDADGMD